MKIIPQKLILIITLIIFLVTSYDSTIANANFNPPPGRPLNVGVLLYNESDLFISLIKKNLENIQRNNEDKLNFIFFDGKGNTTITHELAIQLSQGYYDLLLMNLMTPSPENTEQIISSLKSRNIPFVLFISEVSEKLIFNYKKAAIVGFSLINPGATQGQILVDAWNTDKNSIDKNKDNKLQYIMLKGDPTLIVTTARTNAALETITNAGIKIDELASINIYWDKELAKTTMASLFLRYGNSIEAIISNNDAMAIGAIKALQKFGYNKGNKDKSIAVVGFDAIPEAQELIKKGIMLGSVLNDAKTFAEMLYNVGVNLTLGKSPIEGTQYKLNPTGTIIIPHEKFLK
ncbi:galactose ABC transporter substrate-binding protein [Clostridium cellulovorans]|uniref:D-galactose/methyl-galactoside binding periplasmic protein MglB n=1 Tax=Clostridium cellulovorans (strain ATCC 35296 / DSM 3052 / OCM 3 / 743B) TaxID=573061 RepID=D9SUS9_CLOC7|nr:galactose ABC transporter substrate-binding protein [Clostridium cellulovorans]ADL50984.1 putative galactoside ABC transporter [Clostridium cellulovorans 743B]